MPDVYYVPGGPAMLLGYFYILAVPMMLVIPFAAYRSLAAEREDGTYELLSITTLSSRKIVAGKLGSVFLQMLVYYSAIGPCVAFTYLLRGIDVFTIAFVLIVTMMLSLLLSLVSLFLASVTRGRHWQLMISVIMLLGYLWVGFMWCTMVTVIISEREAITQAAEFWPVAFGFLAAHLSYFAVIFLATDSLNNFPSENRSTRVRIAILVQLGLMFGWLTYMFERVSYDDDILLVMVLFAAAHWLMYGALMSGEAARMTPRAMRSLPQTLLGRIFTTWFNPGPLTGYIFTTTSFGAFLAALVVADQLMGWSRQANQPYYPLMVAAVTWGYLAGYLGVGMWGVALLRRFVPRGFMLPVITHLLILLLGVAVPLFSEAIYREFRRLDYYSLFQVTNWIWTISEVASDSLTVRTAAAPIIFVAGAFVYLIHLWLSRGVLLQVRRLTPQRVVEDVQHQLEQEAEAGGN